MSILRYRLRRFAERGSSRGEPPAPIVVPVVEELFWRGWLMRWLVTRTSKQFPSAAYTPFAFWATALLFASEHGPYWDVGLVTGIIYNLWMISSAPSPTAS